jgi:tetratricopeptide (TPR) repeat protein
MRAWLACLLPILAFGHFAYADDNGNYGPDWPVCQNLAGDPQAEIAACQRLIDGGTLKAKHLSWAYNDRATAWLDLRRPDLAWADFQKSIETDPTNQAPYYNLAGLYNQARRFKEALELYDKALALQAAPPGAYCNRGAALQALGRMDEAIDSYERELAARPDDDCALYRLTELARDQHREDVALAALDRALAANPGDSESFHRRAVLHSDLGQTDLALSDYAEAIRLNPREAGALQGRAMLYRTLEQYAAARADLDAAMAIGGDQKGNLFLRAQVDFLMGDYDGAAADCGRRLEILNQDTACTGLQWRVAMMKGNFAAAVGYADTMVESHIDQYRLFRGVARYADGDVTTAAADFAGYTEAVPGDPYGWLWHYLADRKLGKDDAAKLKEIAARRDAWPAAIIRHIAGLATAEEVLAAADVPDAKLKRLRLAEANYYLGELAALAGDPVRAEALFKSSLAAGRAEIEPAQLLPVYKSDDDLELALANAALNGKGL